MKFRETSLLKIILFGGLIGACIPLFLYAFWLGCRIFLLDQFVAPTGSMEPTLLPGDRIIVNKTIMGARIYSDLNFNSKGQELKSWRTRGSRPIKRDDVVVFNFPLKNNKIRFVLNYVYAKRCIALPGDSIAIENGFYKNNNNHKGVGYLPAQKELSETKEETLAPSVYRLYPFDKHLPWTILNMPPVYIPRKGDIIKITPKEGALYRAILEWETGKQIKVDWEDSRVFADDHPLNKHVFQHNYYYMAGDNVLNSCDSRYWGFVPEEYIVGVVTHISYSIDQHTGKYRKDRLFIPL